MTLKQVKEREARFAECNAVLVKLIEELKIPDRNDSIRLLNSRMTKYIDTGKYAEDRIPLVNSNHYIMYRFPKWAHQQVEVVLRAGPLTHYQLPSNLVAELDTPSRNDSESGLAPTSPPN